jgi:glycerate dehydrogenase
MMKIVVLDGFTANPGDLSWQALEVLGEFTVYERTKPEETIARAAEAVVVLTNKVVLGRAEINQLPQLRYIGVLATGYNVVHLQAASERGIVVTNVPAYSTESVAQMVFAHLLTIANRTEHYAQQNRQGRWSENPDFCYWDTPLTELAGKTFGIVGLGNIGRRVAQIALAFGMQVKAFTSKSADSLPAGIQKADLDELFSTSDVLSLHCPLTDSTHHLINNKTLSQMKSSAIIINTGRGLLVDDEAVATALEQGTILPIVLMSSQQNLPSQIILCFNSIMPLSPHTSPGPPKKPAPASSKSLFRMFVPSSTAILRML